MIFQDLSLFPNLTVEENIAIDLELGGAAAAAAPAGDARGGAGGARPARRRPSARRPRRVLPVAQRQIVAICRGLAANARILFMDEPTASLTRHEVELLLAAIRRLQAQGVAVVFVSHRLEEVIEIAERVTVLRDGRKVGTFRAADLDDHRLAQLMTGESIEHRVTARPPAEPAARARGPAGNPRRRVLRRLARRSAPARSSGSSGSSAPAAPSWRWRSSA